MRTPPSPSPARSAQRVGLIAGIASYLIWGVLPLYFKTIETASPVEIVAARVVFSLALCAVLLTATRSWSSFLHVLRTPRLSLTLALASALVAANWLTYTFTVISGNTAEGSLGYFINPLISTVLGVLVLRERLSRLQWAAMALGLAAVVVLSVAYGHVPWIGLALALTFGFYGLVKNRVGREAGALQGLSVETTWLAPVALVVLLVMGAHGWLTLFSQGQGHFWLLAASGVTTAVPLLTFAAAASRLPLTTIAMLQYIAPTLMFVFAVTVFHEPMPPQRWAGFVLVWIAVVVLIVDALRQARRTRLPGV